MFEAIVSVLVRLNDRYGAGDVVGVSMRDDFKGGTMFIRRHGCLREAKGFHVDLAKNTVRVGKHQKRFDR